MVQFGSRAPRLAFTQDEAKKQLLWNLHTQMMEICSRIDAVYASVTLLDFCRKNIDEAVPRGDLHTWGVLGSWSHVATSAGAIRIKDVYEVIQASNVALNAALGDAVVKVKPSPEDLLLQYFPALHKARHAAAHTGLQTKNPSQRKKHAFTGNHQGERLKIENTKDLIMSSAVDGSTFKATWEGELVEIEISMETMARLEEVKLAFFKKVPESYLAR